MSSITITIDGIELQLIAKRGLFWSEQKTLFVADTHFGKDATFRHQGIPVPRGSTTGTLSAMAAMISDLQPKRLVLLGDMFHAKSSVSQDVRDSLDEFFDEYSEIRFSLVRGNHDRHVRDFPANWPIEIVEPGTGLGRISISHLPQPPTRGTELLLCGHIHPAYYFPSDTDSIGRLRCFWLSNKQLVLPAIGKFTGCHVVKPGGADRVWIIADNQIIEVPAR